MFRVAETLYWVAEVNGEMCKLVSSNLANIKGELRCNLPSKLIVFYSKQVRILWISDTCKNPFEYNKS